MARVAASAANRAVAMVDQTRDHDHYPLVLSKKAIEHGRMAIFLVGKLYNLAIFQPWPCPHFVSFPIEKRQGGSFELVM